MFLCIVRKYIYFERIDVYVVGENLVYICKEG